MEKIHLLPPPLSQKDNPGLDSKAAVNRMSSQIDLKFCLVFRSK
jgi:hypothetical protein